MSYFIFGTVLFRADVTWQEQEECSFKAVELGVQEHLSIQMGANICQPLVKEILERHCDRASAKSLAFLVTGSPIANTSDGLISPFTVGIVEGDYQKAARKTLKSMASIIYAWLQFPYISRVELFFSEGYDESYTERRTTIETLSDIYFEEYEKMGDVPSLRLVIQES